MVCSKIIESRSHHDKTFKGVDKIMKKRNYTIDLMKFGMAIIVAYYHFYLATSKHFIGGGFAVEFFLLTAGVFFFAKLERETEQHKTLPLEDNIYIYIYIYEKTLYEVFSMDVFGVFVYNAFNRLCTVNKRKLFRCIG